MPWLATVLWCRLGNLLLPLCGGFDTSFWDFGSSQNFGALVGLGGFGVLGALGAGFGAWPPPIGSVPRFGQDIDLDLGTAPRLASSLVPFERNNHSFVPDRTTLAFNRPMELFYDAFSQGLYQSSS